MTDREQPNPGDGWRLASGDDCKDRLFRVDGDRLFSMNRQPMEVGA